MSAENPAPAQTGDDPAAQQPGDQVADGSADGDGASDEAAGEVDGTFETELRLKSQRIVRRRT